MKERPGALPIRTSDICEDRVELRRAVSRALALSDDTEWSAMPLGKTNQVWRVDHPAGSLVVKWFTGEATPLFDNDPFAEFACLTRLGGALAPRPVLFLSGLYGRAIVYRFLTGSSWGADASAVAALLRKVHALDPFRGLRGRATGSAALLASASEILSECSTVPDRMRESLARLADGPAVAALPAHDLRPLHGDPVAANIVETPQGLCLIDWQSPGLGDPCEDLAVFLSPSMQMEYRGAILDHVECETFLNAYRDPVIPERYRQLKPYLHLRLAAYALWGQERARNQSDRGVELELDVVDSALAD